MEVGQLIAGRAMANCSSYCSGSGLIANKVNSVADNLTRRPYPFPRAGLIFYCEGQTVAGGKLGTIPLLYSNQ